MFDMILNGDGIPGSLVVNGTGFSGFNVSTNGTVDLLAKIRINQYGGFDYYASSETLMTAFGYNTLPAVPEPSIPALIGIASSMYALLRKRRI